MIEIHENEGCVGCKDVGLPCLGPSCTVANVKHFYCDSCGREDTLYRFSGMELCGRCVCGNYPKVEGSEKA